MGLFSRPLFLLAVPLLVAGCVSNQAGTNFNNQPNWKMRSEMRSNYSAARGEKFPLKAVDVSQLDSKYWRQEVKYVTPYAPGTLVVDTKNRFLYLVQDDDRALRYGVGVGKAGLAFSGEAKIGFKREWPHWAPTQNMINRSPERYAKLAGGMEGGTNNPLGARALYLFKNGQDTHFRIHGSHEAWSIGKAISSGCIRLINQDVIDLYNRVPDGAKVVVLQNGDKNNSDKDLLKRKNNAKQVAEKNLI